MTALQNRTLEIIDCLKREYPDPQCSLEYTDPLQLLISVRLAAQCTDARVNMVTPALFDKYPTAQSFADAELTDVEELIKSCGLYKTKAKSLLGLGQTLVANFDGKVPDTMEKLLTLPGIGRKTANLVLGDIFGQPAVVCDTHCIRLTNLMGLTTTKDPYKCELQLRELLPASESNNFCHRTVQHGRAVCVARRPKCNECCVRHLCDYGISIVNE
ncbi:MAG: endonuclease III [Hydrogenoanaerobacterium sp.]